MKLVNVNLILKETRRAEYVYIYEYTSPPPPPPLGTLLFTERQRDGNVLRQTVN